MANSYFSIHQVTKIDMKTETVHGNSGKFKILEVTAENSRGEKTSISFFLDDSFKINFPSQS